MVGLRLKIESVSSEILKYRQRGQRKNRNVVKRSNIMAAFTMKHRCKDVKKTSDSWLSYSRDLETVIPATAVTLNPQ